MNLNKENQNTATTLGELKPGEQGEITGFTFEDGDHAASEMMLWKQRFLNRMLEIGFLVGEKFEILNQAPFSHDPMSIRLKGAVYAVRRNDANLIQVKRDSL